MRIVIVDDHPIVRSGLEQTINDEDDMEVVGVASTTSEGIAVIAGSTPDLAIVDLKMPGGGGLELIKQCREKAPGCRFIILSSFASYPEIAAAFSNKVEGYILKDALPEELLAAIRLVAGGRRYYDPQVLEYFMNGPGKEPLEKLTGREMEILHCLGAGLNNRDMAKELFISENTVRTHLYNVFRKLSVKNRTQAVSWANEHLRH